ncbi:unnamed protein product [Schistosoma curassoni]|uniref:Ovule protein n=1 Tax=Schistosoma curassoni TaxID=6186 RepID=A0A183K4K5_9TREM|nr:unnamed protein product [Schistosoma curassoni]
MGENKSDSSGERNQEEVLEADRTHIGESNQLSQKETLHLESSTPKEEKRMTKKHITSRNGDRHEKNERKLDRSGKEGRG